MYFVGHDDTLCETDKMNSKNMDLCFKINFLMKKGRKKIKKYWCDRKKWCVRLPETTIFLQYTSTRAFALAGRKEQKIEEDNWSRNLGDLHKVCAVATCWT